MKLINCNLSDAKLLFKIYRESASKGYLRSASPILALKHGNYGYDINYSFQNLKFLLARLKTTNLVIQDSII